MSDPTPDYIHLGSNRKIKIFERSEDETALLGVYVDGSSVEAPAADEILCGENSDVDTSAEALTASTPCSQVLVQAKRTNTGVISVGNQATQPIDLEPGDSLIIFIDDVSKIWVIASVANQKVGWLAKP